MDHSPEDFHSSHPTTISDCCFFFKRPNLCLLPSILSACKYRRNGFISSYMGASLQSLISSVEKWKNQLTSASA